MTADGAVSRETLRRAVEQGLLTEAQLAGILALDGPQAMARADDEAFRLITSFADIFVTLGIGLFVGALVWFTHNPAPAAVAAWLLAEFFTRRLRMALPSIVLLLIFVAASFWGLSTLTGALPPVFGAVQSGDLSGHGGALVLAALLTVAAAGVHYWRFRVPITVAAATAAGAVACLGLAVFALAMRFDMSDPLRQTRRADIAFWLHLLAAPMIVHPLVQGLMKGWQLTTATAAEILVLFAVLGLVAVIVDRRALLVSSLSYAGYAFAVLIRDIGFGTAAPLTALVLGAFVLLLSAAWQPLRRLVLRALPAALTRHLPRIGGRT